MNIKVIGAGCETCGRLYDCEKVEDLIEIVKLGVMTAPSLMVDGKLVLSGRTAKKDEIIRILKSL